MRDGAVVALEEVLGGDLPVACELGLRALQEAQRVEVQRRGGAGAPQGVVDVLDGVEELRVDLGAGDGAAVTALR